MATATLKNTVSDAVVTQAASSLNTNKIVVRVGGQPQGSDVNGFWGRRNKSFPDLNIIPTSNGVRCVGSGKHAPCLDWKMIVGLASVRANCRRIHSV